MKIAVSAPGNGLDAPFSPVFGRYPVFVIVDTDTMAFETIPNQAISAAGGAGIQAAQDVAAHGIGAVVTGSVGPNAYQVLAAAGISIYTFPVGTVRQAVEAYKAKQLEQVASATGPAHAGMGAMHGTDHGMGTRGGGMGGRGGRGFPLSGPSSATPPASRATASGTLGEDSEISRLKDEIRELRHRLDDIAGKEDAL